MPQYRNTGAKASQHQKEGSMTRLTKTKPYVGAMMALMMVVALLASAGPAGAQDAASAEKTTDLSACVGAAGDVFGFEDITDLSDARQDAINCLAHYGITVGRTQAPDPVTYGPNSDVTRSQMALFLYRTAQVAGVDFVLDADDPAAMFSDISDLGDNRQTAIKALYAKSIMTGRNISGMAAFGSPSEDTFAPHEPINRAEMAVYLRNLVRAASPDLFDDDGNLVNVEKLDQFMDARDTTTGATSDAVAAIYELGITTGQTPTTYNPAGFVRRSNMALFITRTLAHTTLRPAGLTVQQDGAVVVVSIRDRDFTPVTDAYVDVFVADVDDEDDAFDSDGECDTDIVRESPMFFHEACEIDVGDTQTGDNGDAEIDFSDELSSDGLVVWVWSGDLRDTADEDDVMVTRFTPGDLPPPAAEQLTVTYSGLRTQPDGTTVMSARKGTKVVVHLQMQGTYSGERDLVDVPASDTGAEYELVIEATIPDDDDNPANDTVYARDRTMEIVLDADGSGSFKLPVYTLDNYDITYTLTSVDLDGVAADPDTARVMFRSGDPKATTVIVDPVDDWVQTGDRPSNAATRNHVRVLVLDQYGRSMSGENVLLFSDADEDDVDDWALVPRNRVYTTRSNGVLIGYEYSGDATVETLRAGVDNDPAADDNGEGHGVIPVGCIIPAERDAANSGDVCGMASVYWADEAPESSDDEDSNDYMVVHADTDNDKIVVQQASSDAPVVVDYSSAASGDAFYVNGGADRGSTYAEDLAEFEAGLEDPLELAAGGYTLTWDQPDRGRWTFNLTVPMS